MKIIVETSARHIHVTEADFAVLFGAGKSLTVKKELSQPGQFAAEERVAIVGPKGEMKGVSILGPFRSATQVEVSRSDARKLGIDAPIRESGVLDGTPGCKLIGPAGELDLDSGVIIAKRHVHLVPETAEKLGIKDKQTVQLKLEYNDRSLIYGDVVARVSASYSDAVHLDTDEANAAALPFVAQGELIV
ncbi:MAG: phosphate propanoyltransferase [Oscillospiraceae bacterium]|nr:phosphate propanoyltransferase [Oscillospiraceae bacterium]